MRSSPSQESRQFWGILTRRERWGLSWRGRALAALALLLTAYLIVRGVHPFLAVTNRVDSNVLVVEGWINEYAVRVGAEEFKNGSYHRVFTTGGPVARSAGYTSDYSTSAQIAEARLRKAGVPAESVQMVPSRVTDRDRTYSSAVALRDWFKEHNIPVRSINIVTEGTHARRSRLLFQKAFGDTAKVGVIAVLNPDYDSRHWWRYSEAVRDVVAEGTAYVYAKLFF